MVAAGVLLTHDKQSLLRPAVEIAVKLLAGNRLGVTPVMNSVAFDLRDDAETKRLRLRDLEGFAFDSAYAANEVAYHTTVLGAVDAALIPSAQNAELKALLVAVRPAFVAHLNHARELSSKKSRR